MLTRIGKTLLCILIRLIIAKISAIKNKGNTIINKNPLISLLDSSKCCTSNTVMDINTNIPYERMASASATRAIQK